MQIRIHSKRELLFGILCICFLAISITASYYNQGEEIIFSATGDFTRIEVYTVTSLISLTQINPDVPDVYNVGGSLAVRVWKFVIVNNNIQDLYIVVYELSLPNRIVTYNESIVIITIDSHYAAVGTFDIPELSFCILGGFLLIVFGGCSIKESINIIRTQEKKKQ